MKPTHTDNRMQAYWTETCAFIKENWPKFTDIELNQIDANYDRFLVYLKEMYNNFPKNEAIAREKLQKFYNTLDEKQFQKK